MREICASSSRYVLRIEDCARNMMLMMAQWNEENNIKFLRVSSEMFPFASHADIGYSLEYAKDELKVCFRYRQSCELLIDVVWPLGCWRPGKEPGSPFDITSRAGTSSIQDIVSCVTHFWLFWQFTQLGSPREVVVTSSVRELECKIVSKLTKISYRRFFFSRSLSADALHGHGSR